MREILAVYLALVYLNVLDIFLTMFHIRHGANEVNPLVERLITDFGFSGMVIFKIIMLVLLGVLFYVALITHNKESIMKYRHVLTTVMMICVGVVLYSVAILP